MSTGTRQVKQSNDGGIGAALAGEGMSGFEDLYRKNSRRVYSLCLRITGNVQEAEDLTTEVFIRLHKKLGQFRGEAAFTTWLHRLTVNQVLMHFRKRGVKCELTTEDGDITGLAECASEPVRISFVDRVALETAIAQLPPGYRIVFVLHDIEGYEHLEIAKMLGCKDGTCKSQLHKARMALRELLTLGRRKNEPQRTIPLPLEVSVDA